MLTQVINQSPYPPIPHSTTFRQDVSGRTGSDAGDLKSQSYPSSPRTAAPSCCVTLVHKWLPPHELRWLFMPSHHVHIPVSIKRKAQKRGKFPPNEGHFLKITHSSSAYVPLTMWAYIATREAGICNLIAESRVLGYNTWGYIIRKKGRIDTGGLSLTDMVIGISTDNVYEAFTSLPDT